MLNPALESMAIPTEVITLHIGDEIWTANDYPVEIIGFGHKLGEYPGELRPVIIGIRLDAGHVGEETWLFADRVRGILKLAERATLG